MGIERERCIEVSFVHVLSDMHTDAVDWSVLHLHIYCTNVRALLDKDTFYFSFYSYIAFSSRSRTLSLYLYDDFTVPLV